jgi:hypothetical protein
MAVNNAGQKGFGNSSSPPPPLLFPLEEKREGGDLLVKTVMVRFDHSSLLEI